MDLLVIPLHLLVSHLLFDRHYTKFSISQKKQARQACMELLTAALHIFVPSVPKGKKEWGNRKLSGQQKNIVSYMRRVNCWTYQRHTSLWENKPRGRKKKTSLRTKCYCTNTFKLIQFQGNYVRANPYLCNLPRETSCETRSWKSDQISPRWPFVNRTSTSLVFLAFHDLKRAACSGWKVLDKPPVLPYSIQ